MRSVLLFRGAALQHLRPSGRYHRLFQRQVPGSPESARGVTRNLGAQMKVCSSVPGRNPPLRTCIAHLTRANAAAFERRCCPRYEATKREAARNEAPCAITRVQSTSSDRSTPTSDVPARPNGVCRCSTVAPVNGRVPEAAPAAMSSSPTPARPYRSRPPSLFAMRAGLKFVVLLSVTTPLFNGFPSRDASVAPASRVQGFNAASVVPPARSCSVVRRNAP